MKNKKLLYMLIPLLLLSYKGISQSITKDSVVILTEQQARRVVRDLEERKYLKKEVSQLQGLVSYYKTYKQNADSLNQSLRKKIKKLNKNFLNQKELTNLEVQRRKQLKDEVKKLKKQRLFGGIGAGLIILVILI